MAFATPPLSCLCWLTAVTLTLLALHVRPVNVQAVRKLSLYTGVIPGFSLGEMLLGNPNVTLRVYDILLGCRADKAPFTVLKLNTLIPLDDYTNVTKYLSGLTNDLSAVQSVDLSPYQVLTPALQSALNDPAECRPVLYQLYSNHISGQCARWSAHKTTMETIRDSKVPAVDTAITTLKASLATLESHIAGVDNKTDMVLTLAAEADNQIQNNMTAVLSDGASAFESKLTGYVSQYATEATYLAYNEIGNCLPLWNLYRSFVVMLCNYGVDSLNGFWFSLGWGLFFFIPVVIVGITVAGYYSTMDSIRNWPE
ncbi:hypothetical protein BaRGS_00014487 [Batillaria attramentaria]|uniref:Uncharacterized protein n=1 Tax=Batillaria attramentaria TaxID=370345 RepID=A0ABD0L4D7_9CAEN